MLQNLEIVYVILVFKIEIVPLNSSVRLGKAKKLMDPANVSGDGKEVIVVKLLVMLTIVMDMDLVWLSKWMILQNLEIVFVNQVLDNGTVLLKLCVRLVKEKKLTDLVNVFGDLKEVTVVKLLAMLTIVMDLVLV
jgi:hypothetical protein